MNVIVLTGGICVPDLIGQSAVKPSPMHDTTATKAAVLAADSALARATARRGAGAFLDAVDTDAVILFWGHPFILRGPTAARPAFLARYAAPARYTWHAVHAITSADGTLGCTLGFSRFNASSRVQDTARRGVYVTCWRRNARGSWRVVGHQRRDSPEPELMPEGAESLPTAPHSATAANGADPYDQMLAAEVAFSARSVEADGPSAGFAAFVAPDGVQFGVPGFPAGPEGARAVFAPMTGNRVILWVPLRSAGAASGGLGFTVGYSTNSPRGGHAGPVTYGKYFTIWRQQPDGSWAYVIDVGSPRL